MCDDLRMLNARTFGLRLLISRRDMGWEQEKLAAESGVSRSRISEIERGKGVNVGVDSIFRLATALGVTVPYLLGLNENPLPDEPAEDPEIMKETPPFYGRQLNEAVIMLLDTFEALPEPDKATLLRIAESLRQSQPPRIIGSEEAQPVRK